jgi:hypothetical protein
VPSGAAGHTPSAKVLVQLTVRRGPSHFAACEWAPRQAGPHIPCGGSSPACSACIHACMHSACMRAQQQGAHQGCRATVQPRSQRAPGLARGEW